jgi:hypothetical protein
MLAGDRGRRPLEQVGGSGHFKELAPSQASKAKMSWRHSGAARLRLADLQSMQHGGFAALPDQAV